MGSDETWARILVVDDQQANVILLQRMLEQWGYSNVRITTDSSSVIGMCQADPPDLIVLDLQMPPPDGFQLMELLRPIVAGPPSIPILVLTADVTQATRQRALASGANDFLSKPLEPVEVRLRIGNLLETRKLQKQLFEHNVHLSEAVAERTADLEAARLELLERLALAAEYRDDNTQEHAQRVGRTAELLAIELGTSPGEAEVLRRAAPLHDIGKIGIPDQILLKHTQLAPEEYELMKAHTRIGAQILSGGTFAILQKAEEIAATHHEAWDGSGYPDGIAGESIPLSGRIVAVADVFDALVHERPYKEAWPIERAVAEIRSLSGRQFDPQVAEAFARLDHAALLAPIEEVDEPVPPADQSAPEPERLEATVRR
jgi:putative nucleotidyltransferase with HDIG domain